MRHSLSTFVPLLSVAALCGDVVFAARHCRSAAGGVRRTYKQRPSGAITDPAQIDGLTFDYIIVGAGNAGMPLANRLSEDHSKSVLIIEAGGDIRNADTVRVANETYTANKENPDHSWIYPAIPQIEGSKPDVWFGKGIGGSTNVNGQVWNAPSKVQVDAFGKLGNQGWSWEDLLEYFKKAQDYHPPSRELAENPGVTYDPAVHNAGGPVTISHPNITYVPQTQSVFVKAVKTALGMNRAQDLQSGHNVGVAFVAQTIHPASPLQRVSSATSYWTPIEDKRNNLVISLNSRATKIVWGDSTQGQEAKAVGVEFQQTQGGQTFTVKTDGEVILSAGTMRSPFLLELSGVGDAKLLKDIGVDSKVDLPGVGRNHMEHYQVGVSAPVANLSWHGFGASASIAQSSIEQLMRHNVSDVEKYVRSMHAKWAQEQVDAGAAVNVEGIKKQYDLMTDGIFSNQVAVGENFFGNGFYGPDSALSMSLYVLTPYSRGYVHAISSDPWSVPEFNPRFFSVPFDMDIEVAHLRSARKIFETKDMHTIRNGSAISPLCNCTLDSSDEYDFLRTYAIQHYSPLDHSVGTCSMMPKEHGGVVDAQFKVYGTKNVRVVDASIIPIQVSAHPQAVIYAIAEKAADTIKHEQHRNNKLQRRRQQMAMDL
ncbi:unnamed protein product [Sympodiomycopsis kandeliae]